ncbi:succinate dehydrogenase, cytochrome b556 subunit [Rhodobacter ferrooxidans]|uniref:Succinate dehydrogenase cytochrome b556 subunit n=1 Tax=Rhodobacter ferrooxidans TaxID=371731 RepID=C8S3C6_9RHOB|nr:succinate dehydrogenase, cytochrome b556 subunit [Rhodobacter sp. SW2]EEW24491.1 succinate dehydrogenase, cytochrome b556 subunit [Rhodobacter sp. SW2]
MAEAKREIVRPLSPHLQVYRMKASMATSVLIRITGVGLMSGFILFVWWLLAAAISPEYFAFVNGIVTSWFGYLIFIGSLAAIWYHYLGGLRHLYWDTGKGLDLETVDKLSWGMVIGTPVLTVLTILAIWGI